MAILGKNYLFRSYLKINYWLFLFWQLISFSYFLVLNLNHFFSLLLFNKFCFHLKDLFFLDHTLFFDVILYNSFNADRRMSVCRRSYWLLIRASRVWSLFINRRYVIIYLFCFIWCRTLRLCLKVLIYDSNVTPVRKPWFRPWVRSSLFFLLFPYSSFKHSFQWSIRSLWLVYL